MGRHNKDKNLEEVKFLKDFGLNIKRLREKYNLTQDDLCARTNFSNQTISDIETGKSDCHNTTIRILAKGFGISISELYSYLDEE